jgi:phage tail sheath protein FI
MILTDTAGDFTAVVSAVNNGMDQVTVLTNPNPAFTAGENVLIKIPSAVTYKDKVVNSPSRVSAWYYNNLIVTDESAMALPGAVLTVGPTGHVCGVISRIDSQSQIGGPSHAPAGIQYAGISGIQGLSLSISERIDAAPLRLAFINRITSFPGSGSVIFGGYTNGGASVTPDEQLIQVMRSLQFIKASLDKGLVGFLWENFSPVTQARISSAIYSFLRNNSYLFPAGLPEAQQFKVISVTPTQDELNLGLLRVRVQVKPNTAVKFIEIDLEYPLPTA